MIFILRIHAIGVPEGVTLLEFKGVTRRGRRLRFRQPTKQPPRRSCPNALTTAHPRS